MDISKLVSQKNAEEGKWFQVVLYGKKQDFALKILGSESDTVQKFQREQFKKIQKNKKDIEDLNDDAIEMALEANIDSVIVRLCGISSCKSKRFSDFELTDEPVMMNGKELKDDEKSYRELITLIPDLKEFVTEKSSKSENFLD